MYSRERIPFWICLLNSKRWLTAVGILYVHFYTHKFLHSGRKNCLASWLLNSKDCVLAREIFIFGFILLNSKQHWKQSESTHHIESLWDQVLCRILQQWSQRWRSRSQWNCLQTLPWTVIATTHFPRSEQHHLLAFFWMAPGKLHFQNLFTPVVLTMSLKENLICTGPPKNKWAQGCQIAAGRYQTVSVIVLANGTSN